MTRHAGSFLQGGILDRTCGAFTACRPAGSPDFSAGQTEVDKLGHPASAHQNVGHFHIAMGQSFPQRVMQPQRHFQHVLGGFRSGYLFTDVDEIPKIPPFDELHREEVVFPVTEHVVDGDDIRMAQCFAEFRLAAKLRNCFQVLGVTLPEHLDSDHLPISQRAGSVDARRAPRGVLVEDRVVSEHQGGDVLLAEMADLVRCQDVFSFQNVDQLTDVGAGVPQLTEALIELTLGDELEARQRPAHLADVGTEHEVCFTQSHLPQAIWGPHTTF